MDLLLKEAFAELRAAGFDTLVPPVLLRRALELAMVKAIQRQTAVIQERNELLKKQQEKEGI